MFPRKDKNTMCSVSLFSYNFAIIYAGLNAKPVGSHLRCATTKIYFK